MMSEAVFACGRLLQQYVSLTVIMLITYGQISNEIVLTRSSYIIPTRVTTLSSYITTDHRTTKL